MHLLDLLALVSAALVFAKILSGFAEKLRIPGVLAELLTGVLLGNAGLLIGGHSPQILATLENSEITRSLSEFGVLLLLFIVGLETDLAKIAKVGKDASVVAVAGVIAPIAMALVLLPCVAPDSSSNHNLFFAATLAATSVGITARVLRDSGKLSSVSGQIILGAAVIDDILGILVLAVVSALVTTGQFTFAQMAILLGKVALFGLGVAVVRAYLIPRTLQRIRPLEVSGTVTILLISLCMICAWCAEKAGLAGIVGAFALGLSLDKVLFHGYRETRAYTLEELIKPVSDFFVPIFFVMMGMSVKLSALADPTAIGLGLVLIGCGVVGKLVCGWVISRRALRAGADRWLIGLGMIPRGEVGLIFAAMGLRLRVLSSTDYTAVVAMVAFTTLVAPFLIGWRSRRIAP